MPRNLDSVPDKNEKKTIAAVTLIGREAYAVSRNPDKLKTFLAPS
jgi:hypothetical protein